LIGKPHFSKYRPLPFEIQHEALTRKQVDPITLLLDFPASRIVSQQKLLFFIIYPASIPWLK
jgi:hypothetical protein